MHPTIRSLAPAVAAASALAACGRGAGKPPASLTTAALPVSEPATIVLPITIPMRSVRAQLERAIPRADSVDRARCASLAGAICHQYVFRRDSIALTVVGDRVAMLAALRYRGRVSLPTGGSVGSCGYAPEPMRRAELRFATTMYWTTAWRLASRNTSLTTTLPDRCEVTLLRVDATPLMRRLAEAQLARAVQSVDSALPTLIDLRRPADSLWRAMQRPMALDAANSVWLVMSPEAIGLAPVVGSGATIRSGLTLIARPRVVSGARPDVAVRPLPPLSIAPAGAGLRVPVQLELPFADVSRRATDALVAETAREPVSVSRVDVSGAGDSAIVRIELHGRLNGTLTMAARPRFEIASRTLVFDDLQYTIASRDLLTRMKATLGAPLIRRAIERATSGGRVALGTQLDSARYQLDRQLNRPLSPDLLVGGGVRALRVTGLHMTPTAFVVRVLLEGEAGLWAR